MAESPRNPLRALSTAKYVAGQGVRTLWYSGHYALLRRNMGGFSRPDEPAFKPASGQPSFKAMRREFFKAYQRDLENIEAGLYPRPRDAQPSQLPAALRRSRSFLKDADAVNKRRLERNGAEVREEVRTGNYPAYYRQNFHYQSGGWFSDESADIYDTQVEVLFTGSADVMRRCVLGEMAKLMKGWDQRKTQLLDLACGTGRFLASVMDAFPRLNATGLDLSPNYTEKAKVEVRHWKSAEVIQGQAEAMPLPDGSQDIIVSIYLFHELPPKVRPVVAKEIARVLKPGGSFVFADSIQLGDTPEMDGLLEYFPEGFHEPYYKHYLTEDFGKLFSEAGLVPSDPDPVFLTKIQTWTKPDA